MDREAIGRAAAALHQTRQRLKRIREQRNEIVVRAAHVRRETTGLIEHQLDRLWAPLDVRRDLKSASEAILDRAISLYAADFGNLQLFDARSRALEIVAQRGFGPTFLTTFRWVSADDSSACGRALRERQSIFIADVNADADFRPYRAIAAEAGYRAVQSTPLISREGTVIGMLSTHFTRPQCPSALDIPLMRLYSRHAADILARLAADIRDGS